ncbi:hypothetical protein [Caballeronia grimmiae]|uniref:Core-binding (CB) domain-containing protein n=1 Tax=Caballeronia grimmiae TaxID=1071679 RepID=A0ABQ1S0N8_9BURK|nr:hypothetical protein [Caballeronia grimmiae]GGD89409.1 hypothetical protein GCM10010985_50030 [Caballeronia grimmiae]
MANQPQQLTLPPPRTYTRTDFTAPRAFVQRLPAATIARLDYDPEHAPHAASADAMERFLRTMRDDLAHGRPGVDARRGGAGRPAPGDPVVPAADGAAPDGEGIAILGARRIVAWLQRHEATLCVKVAADVDSASLVPARASAGTGPTASSWSAAIRANRAWRRSSTSRCRPNYRGQGFYRATSFAFVRAEHELAAVHAYLHRYRDRPTTLRAYTRELERLILWSVVVRRKALSWLRVEDCEAYKDFLRTPLRRSPDRSARSSGRWRSFAPEGLSADGQAHAVRVLRAAFAWLVEVRYLPAIRGARYMNRRR